MPLLRALRITGLLPVLVVTLGCEPNNDTPPAPNNTPPAVSYQETDYQDTTLTEAILYDKILGLLVGSAIGDAMGAPTEMWNQWTISETYGHVDSLDRVMREPSPEGPWDYNLPPGAGTDDTRWKALTVDFYLSEHGHRPRGRGLNPNPKGFANHLNTVYQSSIDRLKATDSYEPEPFEDAMRRVTWLQEWARVTRAYASDDLDGYRDALSRFYGGEMACAGMLYAPVLGAVYPARPEKAYEAAYDLALFDLGYARDVTGLTAALTAIAFQTNAGPRDFERVLQETDPRGYFRSRLLGRVTYKQYQAARAIARRVKRIERVNPDLVLPDNYPYDSLTYTRTAAAYEQLRQQQQDVPFHAGEIHLINLTALLVSGYDFRRAMEFVTNYGRDNDTVAAVTGAILGALHGFNALPRDQRETVLRVNKEVLDLDLDARARALTRAVLQRRE